VQFFCVLQEIEGYLKTSNTKPLQGAYKSLCAELDKLTSVSSKETGSNIEKKAEAVEAPV
jgi:hypothetical protein